MLAAVLALAATAGESEASRQKKRRRKKHRELAEATAASSEPPRPPTTPESKRESTIPVAPETLTSAAMAAAAVGESPRPPANSESKSLSEVPVAPETPTSAVTVAAAARMVEERERKNQVSPPAYPLIEEPVSKEEKKRKKRKHGEAAMVIPPPPTPAAAQNLQMESKVTAEGATARKQQRRQKVEQEQSGHPPFPIDVHPQGRQEAADGGGVTGSQCVKRSSSKKPRVLKKQQPLPQGFSPPVADPNSIDQDPNYSSPYGAFAQFVYKSDRRRDGNGPPLPNTVDRPVRQPPQGHPSSGSSLLTAKETSKATRTTTSNTKQPCPASASTSGSQEEAMIKGKEKPENKMTREMVVRESPCPPANPEYKSDSAVLVTPETLSSAEMIPAAVRQVKEREWKNQEALPAFPLMEEPAWKEEKKYKKRKNGEAAVMIPSPPTAAVAQILQMESKVMAEGATVRKKHRRRKVEHEQYGQPPFPIDVHPQAGEEAAAGGGVVGSQCVKRSSSKKSQVLKKQQPLPQGFFPPMANLNSVDQDRNYSSPFGAFFAQFAYKPDHRQDGNGPPLPNTADRPAGLPPRGHPSSGSSLLTAKQTFKAARATSNTKQPCPASASTSGSHEGVRIKRKEKPEKEMTGEKKPRKKSPVLSASEKRSDKYRRLPLDQLVSPPRSPHKLLQEKYASDPWKVIVICMLLNLTQGKQVRKKVKGFFKRYPDPQTAYTADPEKMAEYLAPLGLQRVKAKRIQKFSKAYVGEEWTYITELCGVGKYAADAYAIFCAGRANEVIPQDHKLVDYWEYVCPELSTIQKLHDAQEAGVMGPGNLVVKLQEVAVSC